MREIEQEYEDQNDSEDQYEEFQEPSEERDTNIIFESVHREYPGGFLALEDVNLVIGEGEFVSLVGVSGAGKSTLLKLIYAEEFPSDGEVVFYGRPTARVRRRLLPYYRRNFGMVFQDFKLLEKKTVFENVAFALEVDGRKWDEILDEVPRILSLVRLDDKQGLFPRQLSGGEQQRVSMARALVHGPRVMIADEPTGNLDPRSAREILDLLLKINELGTTVLLATHDREIVDSINRRVIKLDQGRIVSDKKRGKYIV